MITTSPAGTDVAVSVTDLVIRYGDVTAVNGASFEARIGEVTVILGPNGAGKTSTVEHLEGYRRSTSGHSRVLGLDPRRDRRQLASRVGVMLQNGGIPMAARPADVLGQYAGFFGDPLDPKMILDRVGLVGQARTTYRKLSGGQRQRLSLGLAIIGRPEVVFLDEPSAGVDLDGRDSIREIIEELRSSGVCVIVTTHDLNEAESIADRIVIISKGRVVADGTLSELLTGDSGDAVMFNTGGSLDTSALGEHLGVEVTELNPREYRVEVSGTKTPAIAAIATWCEAHSVELIELRAGRQRLDDVYRHLIGQGVKEAS